MKKLLALALAVLMIAALPTAAFATSAAVNADGGSASIEVSGTYQEGAIPEKVISVDISWDAMSFTYTGGSSGSWDPTTHEYTTGTEGGWDSAD